MSLIANRSTRSDGDAADSAAIGATVGAAVGGTAGLLAGIGALAIPGLGPLVAAGWLAATLAGAGAGAGAGVAVGGLIGVLTEAELPDEKADLYAEGVRCGGSLVIVRTDKNWAPVAERIFDRHNPMYRARRANEYCASGWNHSTSAPCSGE